MMPGWWFMQAQKLWEFRSVIMYFNRSLCSGVVQSIGKILDLIDDYESQFNRPIVLRLNTPIEYIHVDFFNNLHYVR